ncbi:MAG: TRAP transporter small permease [Rhizobiaceae bacterium]|nr:TRAP transporter small permease [Rhizobiaceae bacterium]
MRATIDRAVTSISSGLALVGALAVVIMLVHISAYVVMRIFFASPIPATVEIVSSYYMLAVAFLPIAWAERRGEMISIEVFSGLFPPLMKRLLVPLFVAVVTFGAYVILTYTTWLVAAREFQAGSFVMSLNRAIPVWPGFFMLPIGFALAALVAFYRAVALLAPGEDTNTRSGLQP